MSDDSEKFLKIVEKGKKPRKKRTYKPDERYMTDDGFMTIGHAIETIPEGCVVEFNPMNGHLRMRQIK